MPQVVIDPGHGGHDVQGRSTPYGARAGSTWEKDLNLRLAERVAGFLGGDAILTRAEDRNLALGERAALARASRARAFISLHGHASHDGSEVYVHPRGGYASQLLGRSVQRELGNGAHGDDRVAMGEMAVLDPEALGADTAGCLVECGYPGDADQMMRDPWAFDRLGSAIARGVRSFLGHRHDHAPAHALGNPAVFTRPSNTTITINQSVSWTSELFIDVTQPGDVSINGQVTATGRINDPTFVVQIDAADARGVNEPVVMYETFPLTLGTPLLFARTAAIPRAGRFRIVFYMSDWTQPPNLSVTGSFFF